ncbi:MAG: glycoside hydrolase family 2 [Ruminococcaceae bacterium]|nr:glycoside hydrolase family 2 [Oscillospiraceae bacterium]
MIMKTAYPQPDFARSEWLNLNGTWDFSFDEPIYDRTIEVPYPWGSPLSGINESKDGTGFYRRRVCWNPAGEKIFLIFGAVDYTCEVSVNGTAIGSHKGGYARFEFDVTEIWNRTGENEIAVSATDTAQRSQTYGKQGYGDARGIWQTAWLESRPAAYIKSFFVQTKLDGTVTYDAEMSDAAEGKILCADFAGIHAEAQVKDGKAQIQMNIENPALWSPEDPYLYEGTLTLGEDTVSTYFGIREIGTGKFGIKNRNYITLNGKPYYINGVLDQSFNPKGFFTLPSDDDCREEILRLKRIGINMARIHIKAEEPLKLYWADKLGLLIMEDLPCFWGNPEPETMAQYERELDWQILRDRNHPSIFYWVVFNETWGLFTKWKDGEEKDCREYKKETAEWVVKCCGRVKELDPTRLVEDNSPCQWDHTVTDVNTWHFYSNGYERVKGVVDKFCDNAYVGSQFNYKEGYTMADVPCMNSECGNVWGIQGSAGESDISWQYKYMMNEFRLHDKLCGFVFTEFHDVVNEFNGYYKIDNGDKDFGYSEYGTSLKDLHSQDYLGADFAPMTTLEPGDVATVPLFGSSFTDERHGRTLQIIWQLTVLDPIDGDYVAESGDYSIVWSGYGTFPAGEITVEMPDHDGTAMLSWALLDGGETVMQNGILFDIDGGREDALVIEPQTLTASGWERSFTAQEGNKLNGLGAGEFTAEISVADIPDIADADNLRLVFEASTRAPMSHDYPDGNTEEKVDLNYMLGYRCDPGANRNSFPQTDARTNPGTLEVLLDGESIGTFFLADCPADSRGALSHHYQAVDNLLDEAGSYGYLCETLIPSAMLLKLKQKERVTLTLRASQGSGLSLFGRRSGRYGIGIVLRAEG